MTQSPITEVPMDPRAQIQITVLNGQFGARIVELIRTSLEQQAQATAVDDDVKSEIPVSPTPALAIGASLATVDAYSATDARMIKIINHMVESLIAQHLEAGIQKLLQDLADKSSASSTTAERLRSSWYRRIAGQYWAGYYAFYDAMERIGVEGLDVLHGAQQVAASANWWWAYRNFAVVVERPTAIHLDPQNRLHCEDGPAVAYPDGWAVYAWHGTRVPAELIRGEWTPQDIFREANAEIRRCAIEKMGWPEFIAAAKLKKVGRAQEDPGNPGHKLYLYDVPEQVFETAVRVLLCTNGTIERDGTRRQFGLTVPVDIKTPIEAAAWGYGLTVEEYKRMQVRR